MMVFHKYCKERNEKIKCTRLAKNEQMIQLKIYRHTDNKIPAKFQWLLTYFRHMCFVKFLISRKVADFRDQCCQIKTAWIQIYFQ